MIGGVAASLPGAWNDVDIRMNLIDRTLYTAPNLLTERAHHPVVIVQH